MSGPLFFDRVRETSTTTGTGTYTLAGAYTGFQTFAGVGNSNTCPYCAFEVDANGNASGGWEVGIGTYTASGTTLSRDSILASTNSNAAVSWSAGTRHVILGFPASMQQLNPLFTTGRLTLVSGNAVPTTDRTAKDTLYYTSVTDDGTVTANKFQITLWNGSCLRTYDAAEISGQFNNTLSALVSGKNYDVFIYDNAGTLTLELSAAWTNDITRQDALAAQNGLIVKSGAATRRWVGTIRASATNQTTDSAGGGTSQVGGKRFVYNAYNQVLRHLMVIDSTDSWSYTTQTIRQANGASGNKVEWISGHASMAVTANTVCLAGLKLNNTAGAFACPGLDSTSAFSGLHGEMYNGAVGDQYLTIAGEYAGVPGLGYHFLSWNERGADNTCTFFGDAGDATVFQSGLYAWVTL